MSRSSKSILLTVAALSLAVSAPAFAQETNYGPHQRLADDLNTPLEIDGLALGREAPFLSSEDVGVRAPGRSFEIEGPPIAPALPILPVDGQ